MHKHTPHLTLLQPSRFPLSIKYKQDTHVVNKHNYTTHASFMHFLWASHSSQFPLYTYTTKTNIFPVWTTFLRSALINK